MPAVRLERVSKSYPLHKRQRTVFKAMRTTLRGGKDRFQALVDVDLEVAVGEKLGLVGSNGAGKTTLLKLVAGLHHPDAGVVETRGEIMLIAGLGIGMIDELSTLDNLRLYGTIYGVDREKLEANADEILRWAGLEEFPDVRLQDLSTGMRTRLAFSTARHFDGDVFLLDEAFSGADRDFRRQWRSFFEEFRQTSKTFIVATHDLEFVESFCTRTVWLDAGRVRAIGETKPVLDEYCRATAG